LQDGPNASAALKVLRIEEPIAAPTDNELATMLRLSAHPHIVSVLATGVTTTGRPCVAMQYCQDGSYADILAAQGPLPVGRVVETGLMIASALVAAHAEGLLHGAVTPSNILQTQVGPALSDFPISRPPEDLSGTLGTSTSYHAAPEVLLKGAHSPASDVYGLASTLWTLLAGHPPFARPGDAEVDFFTYRDRALADPAPPVAIDAVPARLQAVLDKALSKNPALRYRSAEDFGTALSTVETQTSSPPRAAPGAMDPGEAPVIENDSPASEPVTPSGPLPRPRYLVERDLIMPEPPPAYAPGPDSPEPNLSDRQADPDPIPPGHHRTAGVPLTYPRSRRTTYIKAAICGVSLGVIVVVALALSGGSSPQKPTTSAAAAPTPSGPIVTPRGDAQHAPGEVRITDSQLAVALSWQDRSDGKASYYVVGGPVGRTPTTLAELPAGGVKTEISGLNPKVNYCFTVLAILDVDQVGAAEPICTKRRA
jgi:serine/threonine protein kinase